jgi:hypothetical protein
MRLTNMSQQVGIFWLLAKGRILIDSTPLDKAERYDRYLIHSASHIDVWERWRREGKVAAEQEYDQLPMGRVAFDWVLERATLLADRRILEDQGAMQEIADRLGLPANTRIDTDPHYWTDFVMDEDASDDDDS